MEKLKVIKGGSVDNTRNDIILREACIEDCRDLFKWRNHPIIRKNSFNTNPMSWNEHERWFKTKSKDPRTKIYIACCGKDKVGTVRFDDLDRMIKVNIMLNPDFLSKGLGSKVIRLGIEKLISEIKLDKPIIAEIKKENIASIKAFQKVGFKESHLTFVYSA